MKKIIATALAATLSLPAFACEINVSDAYIRASGPSAKAAAGFMVLHNNTHASVTLIGAETDVAKMAQLHTHIMENEVAKMREIEGGITIPAGESHVFERGHDHVMLMGLTETFEEGKVIEITLKFQNSEPITIEMPIDNSR